MTQTILRTEWNQPWSEHHVTTIAQKIGLAAHALDDKLIIPGAHTEQEIRRLVPNFPKFTLSILKVR